MVSAGPNQATIVGHTTTNQPRSSSGISCTERREYKAIVKGSPSGHYTREEHILPFSTFSLKSLLNRMTSSKKVYDAVVIGAGRSSYSSCGIYCLRLGGHQSCRWKDSYSEIL